MNLETKHPTLYESFYRGDFVVYHSLRRGSGVPMDQALEKEYNKTDKGPGVIIGVTRQKECVAKGNIPNSLMTFVIIKNLTNIHYIMNFQTKQRKRTRKISN